MAGRPGLTKAIKDRVNPIHVTFEYKQNVVHDFKRVISSTEEDSSDFDEDI